MGALWAAAALLGAALPAAAAPILSIEFDAPSGTAAPDEPIDVEVTVEVQPGSDALVFTTDGFFEAGGIDYRLAGAINIGDFFPEYTLGAFDFTPVFDGLTLTPGERVSFVFATLQPPPGGAAPGIYELGSAKLRILLADLTLVEELPALGTFQRTVPEPAGGAQTGAALGALLALARRRGRCVAAGPSDR